MSNYSQNVFFAPKDSLTSGDPNKVIKGSEIDAELQEISDAIATKVEDGGVPSGTKMIMVETAAPSGWTLNTAYDNRTIIISDGPTDDDTPDTGGSWTISGLTHSHTHGMNFSTTSYAGSTFQGSNSLAGNYAAASHTHTVSGNTNSISTSAVTSDGTWLPNYVEVIVCTKD